MKRLILLISMVFFLENLMAVTVYARADGDWDQVSVWSTTGTGGPSCGCNPAAADDVIIDGYQVDVDANTGNVTVNSVTVRSSDRDDISRLRVQGGAILTVTNDFTIFGNRATQDQIILIEDASRINVGDDFIIDIDSGDDLLIDVDDSGQLNVSGDFSMDKDGGDNVEIHINNNSGTTAEIDIAGDFTYTCDGVSDGQQEILVDDASSLFNVGGNITVSLNGGNDNSDFEFNLDNGDFTVGGYMSLSRGGAFGILDLDADGCDITCDSVFVSSGGTISGDRGVRFYLDGASEMNITNGMTVTMTSGDDFYIYVNENAGSSAEFNVGNDLTITRSNGDDIQIRVDDDNSVFSVGGDMEITSSGGEEIEILIDNNAIFSTGGDFTITHSAGQTGEIDLAGGADIPSFDIGGDLTITYSGGNDLFELDINGGEATVAGNATFSNTGSGNDVFVNLDGGDFTITGDFTGNLSGNDELLIDIDDGSVFTVSGDMELDMVGGNDLELHLGENSTGSTGTLTVVGDLTLDHNGGTGGDDIQFRINDDCVVNVGGVFTMDTDGSGAAGNFYCRMFDNALLNVDGNFVMTSTASGFLEVTLNNNSKIEIGGNFIRQASPNNFGLLTCNNEGTIEYNGTTAQVFAEDAGAGTDGFTYRNVIINNSNATAPQITMEGEATILDSCSFLDGVIASTSTDILVFPDGAVVTDASNASFVDGPVRKAGNEAFTFPVGDDDYRPISISAPGAVADTFDAQYFASDPDPLYSRASLGAGIDHVSEVEYWTLDRGVTSGASVSVTLSFDTTSAVTNLTELLVTRWNGAQWTSEGNGGTTGDTLNGTIVSSAAVTNFSPFTLGSSTANNPLPIELLAFNGKWLDQDIELIWSTAVEYNSDFFTLERSSDGLHYETLAEIKAAGNSRETTHYSYIDQNAPWEVQYYRLKQTDIDANSTTYSTLRFAKRENADAIAIYPNPFKTSFQITNLPENATQVAVYDMVGRKVWLGRIDSKVETMLPSAGVYQVHVLDEQKTVLSSAKLVYQP
ncbi:MAG: hypothetical protein Salg2KO_03170 [Salibacteraceae bacterium]